MIIGVDMRVLANPRRSGVEEYAEQILSRLVRLAPEHQFKFLFSSFSRKLPTYDWFKLPNVMVYHHHIPNQLLFISARLFNWPKLDVLMGGVDVFFSPHFLLAPLSPGVRRVTTFHDLSYERFPEFFTLGRRLWHYWMRPAETARFSNSIIAVSASTKHDLIEYYHIDPTNISIIHNAASVLRPSHGELTVFKHRHQLPDRFIFSLSTLEPRKNTVGLIRAFNILKNQSGLEDVKLLIGGSRGWKCQDVFTEIKISPHTKDIQYLGYIAEDRACYYALASVFVNPSFFEGFGLPVLEAMACGAPVVTSATSSMA